MKRRLNKLFSILLVISMILSMIPPIPSHAATAKTIVLKVNGEWTSDGARFAAYFFVNDSTYKWVSMTSEGNNIYSCSVPSGYGNVIFCRMNGGNTTNSWDNKWNQTSDQKVPDASSCMYTMKSGWWDGDAGTWGACSHSWNSGTVTKAATCSATGVKTYTCNYCNGTKTETIAKTAHNYAAATCTVAQKCKACGATTGNALGHNWVAATCTAAKKCSRCGTTSGNSLGHNYTNYAVTKNPTTSATGTIRGKCSRCSSTNTQTLPKLTTSSYTRTTTKAATCTATGTYTWKWNTTTYGTFTFTTSIAATGHSYTSKVTAPTCTARGYTTYTCSKCSNSYKDNYTSATGHSYADATCTSAKKCTKCGTTTGSALGHNYSYKVTKNPTTSASGTLVGTCTRCSASTGNITIGKLGTTYHTYKVITAATCTAKGTGRYTWGITDYGTYYWDVEIPATGHSYGSVVTKPTCTAQGYTTYTCSKCSNSYKDNYTAATGHSWNASTGKCSTCSTACSHSWNSGSVTTQPTCTATGVKTYTCNTCKTTKTESVAAKGHSYSGGKCSSCGDTRPVQIVGSFNDWSGGNMTYSSSGYTVSIKLAAGEYEFKVLKDGAWLGNYGTIFDDTSAAANGWEFVDGYDNCKLSAIGGTYNFTFKYDTNMLIVTYTHTHAYTAGAVTAPTCTAKGYTTYTCPCGDSYQGDEKAATGHSWSASTGKCSTCGTACSHNWSNGKCSTCGMSCTHSWSGSTCSKCGLGCSHSWNSGSITTQPTCTAAGVKTYTCNTCKTTKTESVAATGHSYTTTVTAPTCTAQGYTTHTCSKCSNSYKDTYKEATGHSYTSKVTKAATCTAKGTKTYTCSKCNHSYTEDIAALGHSYTTKVTAPTCTAEGYTTHTCSRCSDSYKDTYVDAKGHAYSGTTCTGCGNVRNFYLWGYINGTDQENYNFKFSNGKYTLTTTTDCYVAILSDSNDWYMTSGYPGDYVSSATLYNTNQGISDANKLFVPNGATVIFSITVNTNETVKLSYTISSCSHLKHNTDGKCLACSATVSHNWSDGTCSHCGKVCSHSWSAGKCTVCGISCSHSWNSGTVTTQPTCTAKGVKTYTCNTCKHTKTESVDATGHSYTAKVTAPTCTARGYTTHTCSKCNDTYKDTYKEATGHAYTSKVTTAATCTTKGVKTYTCSKCSDSYTEEIAALGHSYTAKVTAPTCTAEGYTTHTCSTCGHSYKDTYKDATGHSYSGTVTKNPTCTEKGVKTYTCSKCSASYTEDIAPTGHAYGSKVTAPTCTAAGYTTYTCSKCSHSYTADETAATGHNHVAGKCTACGDQLNFYLFGFINGGNYACEENGSELGVYKFVNGKLVATFETDSFVAVKTGDNNHWYMFNEYTQATSGTLVSTSAGGYEKMFVPGGAEITFTLSAGSGDTLVLSYEITSCPHNWGEGEVTKAPTCTADGIRTFTCSICSETKTGAEPATGHNWSGGSCTTCGTAREYYLFGFINGSDYEGDDYKFVGGKLVVTFAENSYIAVRTGDRLGWYMAQEYIETNGGKLYNSTTTGAVEKMYVPAGAELTFTLVVNSDDTLTISYIITHCPHYYGEGTQTKAPTCTADGVMTYTCALCGTSKNEPIAALGHKYEAVVTAPNCTDKGYTTHTCSVCSDSYKDTYVNALGHSYTAKVTTEAGCTTDGVKTFTCSKCSHSYTEAIPAKGHSYTSKVTAPTCTEKGYTTYTCACGHSYTSGEVAALGHSYNKGVVTKNPTCTDKGIKTFTCGTCGHSYTEEVAATGHSYNDGVVTAPTCTAGGYTTYTCSACGHSYTADETEALGHNHVAGTCTACGDALDFYLFGFINGGNYACEENGNQLGDYKFVNGKLVATFESDSFVAVKTGDNNHWYMFESYNQSTSGTLISTGVGGCEKMFVPGGAEITFRLEAGEGDSLILSYEITSCPHNWGEGTETKAPTCTDDGILSFTCAICGESKTEAIPAKGHSYVAGKCTVCGDQLTAYLIGFINGADYEGDEFVFENGTLVMTFAENSYVFVKLGYNWYMAQSYVDTTSATLFPANEEIKEKLFVPGGAELTFTLTAGEGDSLILSYEITNCGHNYDAAVTAPTCTAGGYTTFTCTICGDVYVGDKTDALGHKYENGSCVHCGDGCDHDYTSKVTTEPTCTDKGVKTFTCSVCGYSYTEEIAALGHAYEAKVTAPTCTAGGYTTHTCATCGHSYTADEVPASGHAYVAGKCGVCGDQLSYYLIGYVNGADYEGDDFLFENGKLSVTFNEDGYVAVKAGSFWYMASEYCQDTSVTLYPATESNNEKMFVPGGVEVIFTLTAGEGDSLILSYEITACRHDWGEGQITEAPTCTDSGIRTYTCSICGESKTETVEATGHSYVAGVCTACGTEQTYYLFGFINGSDYEGDDYKFVGGKLVATFTEAGYVAVRTGDRMSWYMAQEYIETNGGKLYNSTTTGAVEKMYVPAGAELTFTLVANADDTLTISYIISHCPHYYNEGTQTQAPTCTADGVMTYTCALCGSSKTEAIPALGHKYESVVTAPTCENGGYTTHTCSACGHSYVDGETAALGHKYESVVTAPTCENGGYTTYTCSACGHSYVDGETAALGHNHVAGICTACGDKLDFYLFGFINGGNYACEENGDQLGEFKFVDGKLVVTFTADSFVAVKTGDNNHWYMFESYNQSTSGTLISTGVGGCEKMFVPGNVEITFTLTAGEGDSLILSYETAECIHKWNDGELTKAPTCTDAGEMTYTCTLCGETKNESIEATGHSYVAGKCTACGDQLDAYLIGFINGGDYEGDDYKFENGTLTLTLSGNGYVAVKIGGNWYMAPEYTEDSMVVLFPAHEECNEKLFVPGNVEITFTLTAGEGDSLILSYVTAGCEHSYTEEITKNATCTEDGEKTITCGLCGDSRTEVIPATGHSYIAGKCTACGDQLDVYLIGFINGSDYDGEEYKFVDGKLTVVLTADSYVAVKIGANWYMALEYSDNGSVSLFPATEDCNEKLFVPGNVEITFTVVAGEGDSLILSYVTGECAHSYEAVVTAPTCENGGYTTHTCVHCGDSYTDSETEALGHDYVDGICANCGEAEPVEQKVTVYFDISSTYWEQVYVYTWDANENPTDGQWPGTLMTDLGNGIWSYEVSGNAVNMIFSNGSDQQTGDQVLPTDGKNLFDYADSTWKTYCDHSYTEEIKAPTCTEKGLKTLTCTLCGGVKTEEIPALGHKFEDGVCGVCGAPEPTVDYYLFGFINGANYACEDDRENLGIYKFVDGELIVTFESDSFIAVKTGDNQNWYMFQAYEQTSAGTLYNTSTGACEKMFVPGGIELKLTLTVNKADDTLTLSYGPVACEHSYETVVTEPTCTEGGYTTYTCTICGDSYVGDEVDAKGHNYVDEVCTVCGDGCEHSYTDGVCDNCGNACEHIWSGSTCTVCGKTNNGVTIHLVNTLGWQGVTGYFWTANGTVGNGWPGQIIDRDADGYFTVTLDYVPASGESLNMLFHNFNGGQTADITVSYATLNQTRELWVKPSTSANSEGKYPCSVATAESDLVISPEVNGTEVTFRYEGSATSVYLAGSMNGWSSSATPMTKDENGVWSVTLNLAPGVYEYKFVVNGSWIADPCNGVVGGFDGNNIVVVPGAELAPANKITVVLHFYRGNGSYSGWDVWFWDNNNSASVPFVADTQNKGMIATYTLDGSNNNALGYVVRKSDWSDKEFYDRFIDLSYVKSGTVHFYLNSGSETGSIVYGSDVVTEANGQYANLDYESGTVWFKPSMPIIGASAGMFSIVDADGNATGITVTGVTLNGNGYTLTLSKRLSLIQAKTYKVKYNGCLTAIGVNTNNLFYSSLFNSEYNYTGNDLGANWSYGSTTFKVWAPTANAVSVLLYTSGNYGQGYYDTVAMTPADKGVWTVTVPGNLNGIYYNYLVDFGNYTVEATDPYAKAVGINGDRGMVINLDSTDPAGWDNDVSPNQGMSYTDAIIYEMHVREFTLDSNSGVKAAWRGKYLGLTQTGTSYGGHATALDYLKELGVTHVQLMPVYDFKSVDEYHGGYAWGYDPQNFNVPEGSYSTDPYHGEVRINEFKEMVQTFHENGINVVMDVVYNHAFDGGNFCYNKIVPNYFSRFYGEGNWSNGSGCGNDMATERVMTRNFIVDSIMHWVEEYHIDGFRFDLAGLIDTQTINEIVSTVHAKYPYVMFYGEGWAAGDTAVEYGNSLATKGNAWQTSGFGYFNDDFRNIIAGDNGKSWGFASGSWDYADRLANFFRAGNGWANGPSQTINYVSAHDNYCLTDKLLISRNGAYWDEITRMNALAGSIVLLSEGVPFLYSGDEMLREKLDYNGNRVENGFSGGDYANQINWADLTYKEYSDRTSDYYAGLIEFRKNHAALRCTSGSDAWNYVTYHKISDQTVLLYVSGYPNYECSNGIVIIFNGSSSSVNVNLGNYIPSGYWQACIHGTEAGVTPLWGVDVGSGNGTVGVDAISTTVLVLGDLIDENSVYNKQPSKCAHTNHNTSAMCTSCGKVVNHSYSGGKCTVCGLSQSAPATYTVYFDNSETGWSNVNIYAWTKTAGLTQEYTGAWSGSAMTLIDEVNGIWAYELPIGATNIIFNGSGGQSADLTAPGYTSDATLYSDGAWITYEGACDHQYTDTVVIPVTCVGDGEILHTCDLCGYSYSETVEAPGHIYETAVTEPTCTEWGFTTYTCTGCDKTYDDDYVENLRHDYVDGTCDRCGTVKAYYLFGYINGSNYACEEDISNMGTYKFADGQLVATFEQNSYVAVKTVDNEDWYMTDGFQEGVTSVTLYNTNKGINAEKLFVPAGIEVTFTLVAGEEDTLILSYTTDTETCAHTSHSTEGICPVCGETVEHSYESVVTAPTCTAGGYTTHTCPVCGDSYMDAETEALGHSYVDGICENCGAIDPATCDHEYEDVVTEPTCENGGYTTHTCVICGDSYVDAEVEAPGHSFGEDGICTACGAVNPDTCEHVYESDVTEPTCEEAGYTTHTCTLCGDVKVDTEVEALGHTYESVVTEPTCEEAGYTTHTCSVCGDSYVDTETEALGHTFVDGTCEHCGEMADENCEHEYESVVTDPTCTEAGYTTHTCKLCGNTYTDTEVEATGHSFVDGACEHCGAIDPATCEHDYESVVTEPTCEKGGYTTYTCKLCGHSSVGDETETTGHSFVDGACEHCGAIDPAVCEHEYESVVTEPTCEDAGYTTHTCTLCGDVKIDTEVEALGHSYGEDGTCTACGQTKPCEHAFEDVVTEPTCEEPGYTTHTCTLCGEVVVDTETEALGHSYGEDGVCTNCGAKDTDNCEHVYESVVIAPTCTVNGCTKYTCTLCGHSYEDAVVEAAGHTYSDGRCTVCRDPKPLSTDYYLVGWINGGNYGCEEDGANMGIYKFENNMLKATFDQTSYVFLKTAGNENWYMCDGYPGDGVCSANLYNTSLPINHDKVNVPGSVEITFTLIERDDGSVTMTYVKAGECPHDYYSWTSWWPGCTTTGEETYRCIMCADTYTKTLPAKGHNYSGAYCTDCGAENPYYNATYYLVGYINGANYGCEEDWANTGSYKFANGKLTVTFDTDSYVYVKTGDNAKWFLPESYVDSTSGTLYNGKGYSEKMFVPGGRQVTFTLRVIDSDTLSLSYVVAACNHDYSGSWVSTEPGCTTTGVRTYYCVKNCGATYDEVIPAKGHNYVDGACGGCGSTTDEYVENYYLFGYINGGNYACEENRDDMGQYKFVDGKLVVRFEQDSYIAVKTSGNLKWYMAQAYIETTNGTLYNTSTGAGEKMFVPGGAELVITLTVNANDTVTLSYVNASACNHSYTTEVTTEANCGRDGLMTYTCSKCGLSYTESIPASGEHNFVDGCCTVCCLTNEEYVPEYYLFGYINGADYGCNGDTANMGDYKFVDGKLTVSFESDSYVAVKTSGNAFWYMAQSYIEEATGTFYRTTTGASEKMFVPGGMTLTFTLTVGEDDTLTLSYAEGVECEHSYTSEVTTDKTCDTDGVLTYTCELCGHSYTEAIPAGHTYTGGICDICGYACEHVSYTSVEVPMDCVTIPHTLYTCDECDHAYKTFSDDIKTQWSPEVLPEGIDPELVESKNQYRFAEYLTLISFEAGLEGYDLVSSAWVNPVVGSNTFVKEWHAGFDATHEFYALYSAKVEASETETEKVELGEEILVGHLYFHWCGDGVVSDVQTEECTTFHVFYQDLEVAPVSDTCEIDEWFTVEVYAQEHTTSQKEFTYGYWNEWSEWSDESVEATETRKVEARTVTRYVDVVLPDHTYEAKVETEATCTEDGVMVHTCTVCGDSYTETIEATGHSYVDGTCEHCGEPKPVTLPTIIPGGAGLAFKDEIYYNVYFMINNPDQLEIVEGGIISWTSPIDGTIDTAEHVAAGYEPYSTYFKTRSNPIDAKNMGEELYMKVYVKLADGTYVYSQLINYSAKTYAMNKINDPASDAGLKALCVALMNYGASAQQYFGYKADELMNADISEEAQALVSAYSDSMIPALVQPGEKADGLAANDGFVGIAPSVNFGGALGINYTVLPNKAVDGDVKLYIWTEAELEANETLTLENAKEVITMTAASGGTWSGRFKGISAKNAGDTIYACVVYTSGDVEYRTGVVTYSVAAYCQSYANKAGHQFQNMASLAAVYTYYANAYLGN